MTFDLETATDTELVAKQRWYEARGTRFLDQIAEIRYELGHREQRRREGTPPAIHPAIHPKFDAMCAMQTMVMELTEPKSVERGGEPETGRSVVAQAYRQRYAERGNKRGCDDWLHRLLDELCLVQGKLDVAFFESLLTVNSVKHEHWNRTTPGWQGRLRMSGRVALAGVLRRNGFVATLEGVRCAP